MSNRADAKARMAQLSETVDQITEDVAAAWRNRDDIVLGYPSWEAYCLAEFGLVFLPPDEA